MAGRTVLIGFVILFAFASPGSASHSPWPDARHGWETRGDTDTGGLYSTEDGGRHWHLIFPARGVDIMDFLRTSATGGAISVDYKAPEQYWTRDNGRHWYFTRRLPAFWQDGTNLAGTGRFLFWSRGHLLYQVKNWPPPPRAELRLRPIGRILDGRFTDLAAIPGGAVGVVLREPASPSSPLARVFIRRFKGTYVVRLRDPDPDRAARIRRLTLFASWPELSVLAEDDRGNPIFTWRSRDGGRQWSTPVGSSQVP